MALSPKPVRKDKAHYKTNSKERINYLLKEIHTLTWASALRSTNLNHQLKLRSFSHCLMRKISELQLIKIG